MKCEVEYRTKFDMECDGTESLEILEDRAWDKFAHLEDEDFEWELTLNKFID